MVVVGKPLNLIVEVKNEKRKIILFFATLFILTIFFPVKFTKKLEDIPNDKFFYIVCCISEGSTDAGTWIIVNSNNPILNEEIPVYFKGKNPKKMLSYDICNNYTKFIIYGKLTKEDDEEFYTLNSHKWEILDEVNRGNYSFRIPFKHFITIYDLKCFDFLLTDKGYD